MTNSIKNRIFTCIRFIINGITNNIRFKYYGMSNQKLSIKSKYHDVLFWATSPLSKGTKYHLTQREETILRKLIHYDSSNKYISYPNSIISMHTYVSEVHLLKIIPSLFRKEYINVSLNKITRDGQFITYRTIRINWNTIEQAFNNLPIQQTTESVPEDVELEASNVTSEPSPEATELENELIIEQSEPEQSPEDTDDEQLVSLSTLEKSFDIDDIVNVYTVLPVVGFSIDDIMYIISKLDTSKPTYKDLIMWSSKHKRFYNDSELILTDELLANLNLLRKPFDITKAKWKVN